MGSSRTLNKYAFVSPIAIASSFFPKATLPASDWLDVQGFGSLKSSSNKIFPVFGRISAVGVTIGVGNAVGVAVGGDHTIVGVTVTVGGSSVSVGKTTIVGARVQALLKRISIQK